MLQSYLITMTQDAEVYDVHLLTKGILFFEISIKDQAMISKEHLGSFDYLLNCTLKGDHSLGLESRGKGKSGVGTEKSCFNEEK